MEKIGEYLIVDEIAETRNSTVFRGKKANSYDTVIIVLFKVELSTHSEIARFKREYDLIKRISLHGVIAVYDIFEHNNRFALVLEDFEGVSVKTLLDRRKCNINEFLQIAVQLCENLGELHKQGIVHNDIKPQNILINEKTKVVKISDFGISTVLTRENEEIYDEEVVMGTMAYMSPEQTGRMNRSIDYRTDLYSLGITFYEMLSGEVPFRSTDPLEIIHSHIAKKPVPLFEKDKEIPIVISNIVLKLLRKTAEERYQNAFGILADFKTCIKQLQQNNKIIDFEIGKNDISFKFNIPQKIYGREIEIEQLLGSFENICLGITELVLVSGSPGIGKSALVNEIHKPIVAKRGYFITGKFDQFRKDIPYNAIIQAYQGLVRQILSEPNERIEIWRKEILIAVANSGNVLIDLIPEVELLIGKQPELLQLGPEETRNRFNIIFERFAAVFAQKEHPVVIFLDDLQWADFSSLELIRNFVLSENIRFLFIIGSYRDNEVSETHPLTGIIEEISKPEVNIKRIELSNLYLDVVSDLVGDVYNCADANKDALSEIVFEKTSGNPFFIIQFLQTLYDEKIVKPDKDTGWKFDINSVRKLQVTDNVVEFLSSEISKLSIEAVDFLKVCSCIGNEFDLETVALVIDKSVDEALQSSVIAAEKGFISIVDADWLQFSHDRIQEATYSLLSESEKKALHYKIGCLELKRNENDKYDKKLFFTVDQLNFGIALVDEEIKNELIKLNLHAGVKAKASAAFEPALKYLKVARSLLHENSWDKDYELSLEISNHLVEGAYLCGDLEQMHLFADEALSRIKEDVDKVDIYVAIINAYGSQREFRKALNILVAYVNLLKMQFVENPNPLRVLVNLIAVKYKLMGKDIGSFTELPRMTDPRAIALMKMMGSAGSSAYNADADLFGLACFKLVILSLEYGRTDSSPFLYVGTAAVFLAGLNDIDTAYKFGQLALALLEKPESHGQVCRVKYVYSILIHHWKEHLKETIEPAIHNYQIGVDIGDIEYAAYSLLLYDMHSFILGKNLVEYKRTIKNHVKIIEKLNQKHIHELDSIYYQAALNLLGENDNPDEIVGIAFNEHEAIVRWRKANAMMSLSSIYIIKCQLSFLFYRFESALQNIEFADKFKKGVLGCGIYRDIPFYDSLVRLSLYPKVSFARKVQFQYKIRMNQKIIKHWMKYAPVNNEHRYYLIEAEKARVFGNITSAMDFYDKAVKLSKKNEYLVDEAIASELAAGFYFDLKKENFAQIYITNSLACFQRWGAKIKIKYLEEKYPELLSTIPEDGGHDLRSNVFATGTVSESLDFSSVMKASQAISGEIVIGNLLKKLMGILMENAGADKVFMIFKKKGMLCVEAEAEIVKNEIPVLKSVPMEHHTGLSSGIVNYVARTKETVILNNAASEGEFKDDLYVIKHKPKSVLCAAILNQGRLSAILYLENNLSTNAFTPERLELLYMLSSQAAISIDNARLYENLEEKVDERTAQLKVTQEELVEKAHKAGMADVAIGTLHNVGNILNSVKVSAQLIDNLSKKSQILRLRKANELLRQNIDNLETFFIDDPKGKKLIQYYLMIEKEVDKEQDIVQKNVARLIDKIHDIEQVVLAQQDYAGSSPLTEVHVLSEIVDNALFVQNEALIQHKIKVLKKFHHVPKIPVQKTKLMHILFNLIQNAIDSMVEYGSTERKLSVSINQDDFAVLLKIQDTGKGIVQKDINEIFAYGYSVRKKEHSVGLHNCANYMTEMNGTLWAESNGKGKGATFVMKFSK